MSDDKQLKEETVDIESKSFDDAELEDIMNEIEELEKDFSNGKEQEVDNELSEALGIDEENNSNNIDLAVDKESVQPTQLQGVIDQEVEGILDDAIASSDEEPQIASNPEPIMEEEPEPIMEEEPEPVMEEEPEPVMEEEPEPVMEEEPEPIMEEEPEPIMEEEPEPVMEEEPEPIMEEEPGASDISARDEALEAIENKIVAFESGQSSDDKQNVTASETRMDFSVSGQMRLKLNFEVSGRTVELSVDEESGFVIEMGGGVRFSIPIEEPKRKAS